MSNTYLGGSMKRYIKAVAAVLAVSLAMLAAGCNGDTVAKVNGEPIKRTDLDTQVARFSQNYPDMFTGADGEARLLDFKRKILSQMIDQELLRQASEKEGVAVSAEEVDKQIQSLRGGFPDEKSFTDALEKSGITLETLKQQVADQMTTQRLLDKIAKGAEASEAEVEAYYDKNKASFVEEAASHAAHILFGAKDKVTAEKVLARIEAGEDFGKLAKQYSKDTVSQAKGGDLGWPSSPYVQEFQAALDKLEPGEVSGLVKTTYGLHIIKLIERRTERQKSLKAVSDQIRQILMQQSQAQSYQGYVE
ncbi:MAG: hypothetical protein FDZ70_10985, partial [Actinobacteria bacterium]